MSETTAVGAQALADFVDRDFARRLEMAETILPDCVEAMQRDAPDEPFAATSIAGGTAFFGGRDYPANQMVGMGLYGEVTAENLDGVENFLQPGRSFDDRSFAADRCIATAAAGAARLSHCRI